MATKTDVFAHLSRELLLQLLDHHGLKVADRRVKTDLIEALAGAPQVKLPDVLGGLSRDDLKAICRGLGLDDSGKEKAAIIGRIVGGSNAPVATPEPPKKAPANAPAQPAEVRNFSSFSEIVNFIWRVADLLRGPYKPPEYGKVMLPLTVLRRLDCVLFDTKPKVLAKFDSLKGQSPELIDSALNRITGVPFHNTSRLDFPSMLADSGHLATHLTSYIRSFSKDARDIFLEHFKFQEQVAKLDGHDRLYMVMKEFSTVNLHPSVVDNHTMGLVFEELIRRFSEQSNDTAGDYFTPREVIRLMVDLLFVEDDDLLRRPGIVRSLYDPTCGSGGMLSVAEEYLRELNPDARLLVYGQEQNAESFAICKSDMMIKGQDPRQIILGDTLTNDGHSGTKFDYLLSNPPFGVDWKTQLKDVQDEHQQQGHAGRFGPGLPRISDGSLLFLLHQLSKMKTVAKDGTGGSRLAIVFNGSPLFSGDAGSGESEIRRWVIENDWLEAIVGLPDQLFYNTGISTYVWVVTNRKPAHRRGKVQLINATERFVKMRKSLGNKRNELSPADIDWIVATFGNFELGEDAKLFDNEDFGYRRITVERPLRLNFGFAQERVERLCASKAWNTRPKKWTDDEWTHERRQFLDAMAAFEPDRVWRRRTDFRALLSNMLPVGDFKLPESVIDAWMDALSERDETADICRDSQGNPESDADLRDSENVPLKEDIHAYFEREVKPHVPDAWIDESKTKVGYEIPFTRHFYKYKPLRPLAVIEAEIKALEGEIQGMLGGVMG